MSERGVVIPAERCFTNLYATGNTGSASIYLLLDGLLRRSDVAPGQTVLCVVPESGRFLFGYVFLRVVGPEESDSQPKERTRAGPRPAAYGMEGPMLARAEERIGFGLASRLAAVFDDLLIRLNELPIVKQLSRGELSIADYRGLLFDLRQQVIEGSRWISRAASNIEPTHFEARSAFLQHALDEHRDFELLEKNFVAAGGDLGDIRSGSMNPGSQALSAYMLAAASEVNPFQLLGAMYIIEGLGQRAAGYWAEQASRQLRLPEEATSFFRYHSKADITHFGKLERLLTSDILSEELADRIVRCARDTAALYLLQLEHVRSH
jgi:3-oxoacyl-[acyl-carrier-protein] synthase-3